MKLSVGQSYATEVVALRKRRLDDARRAAERALRAAISEQVSPLQADYELAVVEADRLGVPKAQIARAVGTTNPRPIREILNRAAIVRRSVTSARYSRGESADLLLVRLDGDDLVNACNATGWVVADALTAGVDRAVFKVTPTLALVSETPSFVAEAGRLHPGVWWIRASGSAEALAWWTETR